MPEFSLVDPHAWFFTEKIDGTNVRLIMREEIAGAGDELRHYVELRGRTDRANMPGDLKVEVSSEQIARLFGAFEMPPFSIITLYGEAYGAGIQKGGGYSPTKRTRFFDMVTQSRQYTEEHDDLGLSLPSFRTWAHLNRATSILGLDTVPIIHFGNIPWAVDAVAAGIPSIVAEQDGGSGVEMEGLVGRTEPYLYDFRGHRVFFKIKTKDLR
jgi:hypothetical protein